MRIRELRAHRDSCRDCPEYTQRLLRFEGRLEGALRVTVPPRKGLPSPCAAQGHDSVRRIRRGWLAMAASVLVALVVAGSLWLAAPGPSLAADVVAHMAGEPQAWARTDVPVSPAELTESSAERGHALGPRGGHGHLRRGCLFRGRTVPHLVVQTEMGPVTVMVLVHESVAKPVPFDEEGYRGVIVPEPGHGSLAVLARGQDAEPDAVKRIAARVQAAIIWTG